MSYLTVPGLTTTSSLTRFKEIVVGESSNNQTVMNVYGNINVLSLTTNPGGAYLSNTTLTNLSLPVNPLDAANKEYVDSIAIGLIILSPVQAATTPAEGNITLSGLQTIDGYTTLAGDRILVKNQINPIDNGLYNAEVGAWTRTSDMATGSSAARSTVLVQNGTINQNSIWVCTSTAPNDIVGTDPLYFSLFIAGLVAGAGLSQVGNTLNVNVDNIGIQINGSNQLQIVPGGITNADLQNSSITINTTNGIQGGSTVSLGGSVSLSVDSTVVRTTGMQTIGGSKLFTDPIFLMSGVNGISLGAPTLSASYALTFPTTAGSSGQVLTTDGTGILSWTTVVGPTTELFYAYGPASSVTVTNTFTTIVIVNSSIADSRYVNTSGSVQILSAGVYEISYWTQFQTLDNSGGQYSSFGCEILQNSSVVNGSLSETFLIENNGALVKSGCGKTILVNISINDTIALQAARTTGTTTGQITMNECTLEIKLMR